MRAAAGLKSQTPELWSPPMAEKLQRGSTAIRVRPGRHRSNSNKPQIDCSQADSRPCVTTLVTWITSFSKRARRKTPWAGGTSRAVPFPEAGSSRGQLSSTTDNSETNANLYLSFFLVSERDFTCVAVHT